MKKDLYTKDELYNLLKKGAILDELLDMSDGQECTIFKADYFPEKCDYNIVIYIPDLDMNDVVYNRKMTLQEIADAYTNFYTAQDFIDICEGDEKKARRVFYNCDWQHPSTEFTEMEMFDEEDDEDWDDDYDDEIPFGTNMMKIIVILAITLQKLVGVQMTLLMQRKEKVLY